MPRNIRPPLPVRRAHLLLPLLLAGLALLSTNGLAQAQSQQTAPTANLLGATMDFASMPAAPAPATSSVEADLDDPIDDRGYFELAADSISGLWSTITFSLGSMFSAVTPPTPAAMVKDWQDDSQKSTFFQLVGDAGYKIKEIENGVGLPPAVTIKFGRIRNLSDADIDYMEREVERWARKEPGLIGDVQRAAISTLVAINQSDAYVVDTVSMRVLPLPQFKFTLAPAQGGLGWESSQLMRAVQRLDRRVAEGQGSRSRTLLGP